MLITTLPTLLHLIPSSSALPLTDGQPATSSGSQSLCVSSFTTTEANSDLMRGRPLYLGGSDVGAMVLNRRGSESMNPQK